jgi:hypothetical protein
MLRLLKQIFGFCCNFADCEEPIWCIKNRCEEHHFSPEGCNIYRLNLTNSSKYETIEKVKESPITEDTLTRLDKSLKI